MTLAVEKEIGHLRSLFWSARDPEGRAFAPLADAYRRAGDYKKALELLNEGLDRLPAFAPGHVVAARLYLEKGLLEEAELASRQALDLDDENTVALEALAGSLQALGRLREATEVRERLELLEATGEARAAGSDRVESPLLGSEPAIRESETAVEGDVVDVADLAPDAVEPVVDLDALAPDEVAAGMVVDLGALAPEEIFAEEEAEVEGEATDGAVGERVVDLDALAPDEAIGELVVDLGALAPEEIFAEEEAEVEAPPSEEVLPERVVDLDALAPDEAGGQLMVDLDSLIHDETADGLVVDLSVLEPEEIGATEEGDDLETRLTDEMVPERVVDLDALAPDETAGEMVVDLDVDSLTPDETADEPVVDLDVLIPDETAAGPDADLDASVAEEAEEPAMDLGGLAPQGVGVEQEGEVVGVEDTTEPGEPLDAATAEELPSDELEDEPLVTRTMAELYAQQGLVDRALEVFSELLRAAPDDEELRERVRQLEATSGEARERPPIREPVPGEAEPEDHLWQSEPPDDSTGVDTPFAWTEDEVEDIAQGPRISSYFDRILSWRSEKADRGSDGREET